MPKLKLKFAPNAQLDKDQNSAVCKFAKLQPIKGIAWWRVGTGKTRIALGLLALLLQRNEVYPFLSIFVARPSFFYDLREEVKKIGLNALVSSKENDWLISKSRPTILFVSFANLQSILDEFHWIKKYLKLVIVDELYLFSNPTTERSKNLRELCLARNVIGLSGTILPARDNFALWGQCKSISIETKLARNATDFRSQYQSSYTADFGKGNCRMFQNLRGWERKALARLDENISIHMPKSLNRTTETITYVPLTTLQKKLIRSLLEDFYLEYNDFQQDYNYTIQVVNKVRGIINGWIESERGRVEFIPTQKVAVLKEKLCEIYECHEQCIVWCAFRNDIVRLQSEIKIANLQMVGGRRFDINAFHRLKHSIVYATLGSGSSVNYFKHISYAFFFSLGYKKLDYEQAKGRNDRRSSDRQHVANYGHIQAQASFDTEIYKYVQKTRETEEKFIESFYLWQKRQLELCH